MKWYYLAFGIINSIVTFLTKSDTIAIMGLICFVTFSILDKIEKNENN